MYENRLGTSKKHEQAPARPDNINRKLYKQEAFHKSHNYGLHAQTSWGEPPRQVESAEAGPGAMSWKGKR